LDACFHESSAEGVAVLFSDLIDAAEFKSGATPRRGVVHTCFLVRGDLLLDVKPQFVINLSIHGASIDDRSQSKDKIVEHGLLR